MQIWPGRLHWAWAKQKEKEQFTLLSNHDVSLLREQPRAGHEYWTTPDIHTCFDCHVAPGFSNHRVPFCAHRKSTVYPHTDCSACRIDQQYHTTAVNPSLHVTRSLPKELDWPGASQAFQINTTSSFEASAATPTDKTLYSLCDMQLLRYWGQSCSTLAWWPGKPPQTSHF